MPDTKNVKEVLDDYVETTKKKIEHLKWGSWRYDREQKVLYLKDNGFDLYEIDMSELTTSAEILDYIFQLKTKSWLTPKILFDLIEALEDLLNPQENYCSNGVGKKANPQKVIHNFLHQFDSH